jgi:hypothetical protein
MLEGSYMDVAVVMVDGSSDIMDDEQISLSDDDL